LGYNQNENVPTSFPTAQRVYYFLLNYQWMPWDNRAHSGLFYGISTKAQTAPCSKDESCTLRWKVFLRDTLERGEIMEAEAGRDSFAIARRRAVRMRREVSQISRPFI
jgi:hypothetical protein